MSEFTDIDSGILELCNDSTSDIQLDFMLTFYISEMSNYSKLLKSPGAAIPPSIKLTDSTSDSVSDSIRYSFSGGGPHNRSNEGAYIFLTFTRFSTNLSFSIFSVYLRLS